MKKLCLLLLTLTLVLALTGTALAADAPEQQQEYKDIYEYYAYMDLDSASAELQEKILEARKVVTGRTEWIADQFDACVGDIRTGEIIRVLPHFSELFPGWDPPVYEELKGTLADPSLIKDVEYYVEIGEMFPCEEAKAVVDKPSLTASAAAEAAILGYKDWINIFSANYYLQNPSNVISPPFAVIPVDPYTMGNSIRTYATSLTSSQTWNIGYSDYNTGASLG